MRRPRSPVSGPRDTSNAFVVICICIRIRRANRLRMDITVRAYVDAAKTVNLLRNLPHRHGMVFSWVRQSNNRNVTVTDGLGEDIVRWRSVFDENADKGLVSRYVPYGFNFKHAVFSGNNIECRIDGFKQLEHLRRLPCTRPRCKAAI